VAYKYETKTPTGEPFKDVNPLVTGSEQTKTEDVKVAEALSYFAKRFDKMDRARKPYFDNFEKDEKLFRSHMEFTRKADWQSKHFIPRTYGLVMSCLSEFAINKPDIIVEPDTRSDAMKVPYMKAVMTANWRKNKGNGILLYALLDALKLGIAIIEVGYRKDKREIKEITKYDPGTNDLKWKSKEIYDFDDVYFEVVNPRYFWADEGSTTLSKANDCARLYIYSEEAFHTTFDSKFPNSKKVTARGHITNQDEFFKPFIERGISDSDVGVYKYTNKAKDVMWWIANGVLLNEPDDPIPYHHKRLPYAEIKITPYDSYTFYGLSLPRLMEDLQHELNTLRNMAIDQTHLNIFSPFFYSADEDLDESIFTIEPGVGIPVTDPASFNFFKQQQVGADAYNMMTKFDEDVRQATGIDLRMQGLPSGGTATETAILKETSLKRINLYLRFLEELNMPDFAELWGDTLQQFYFESSEAKTKNKKGTNEKSEIFRSIKIPKADIPQFRSIDQVGEFNFLNVTPNDIRGEFGFNTRIGTSISISKELDKQVKLQLYSVMRQDPLVKPEKLVIDVFKAHDYDPEDYMANAQEMDVTQSVALAEEHNRQMIAGENPQIVPEMISPEHIMVHDAFIKSGGIDNKTKQLAQRHTMEEVRLSQISGIDKSQQGMMEQGQPQQPGQAKPGMGGAQQGIQFPAAERNPQLNKPLSNQPGMSKASVTSGSAMEVGSAILRPTVKPK